MEGEYCDEVGFELVRPIESHARQIMRWRNDPEVLLRSFNRAPLVWERFWESFPLDYFHFPDFPPLFILFAGRRVGFFRFRSCESDLSPMRRSLELSIVLAEEERGKGIGKRALIELSLYAKERGFDDLFADVLAGNERSHRLFLSAGYGVSKGGGRERDRSLEEFSVTHYVKRLSAEERSIEREPVLVVGEAGSNWRMGSARRDVAMAKRLVDVAGEAGCDIVKFQCFREGSLYVDNAGTSHYLAEAGIDEAISSLVDELSMAEEMVEELHRYCKESGIELLFSSFSERDFSLVDPFVARHKIASYESNHIHLLRAAAASGKPTLLSTGAATHDEISWAVEYYREHGGKELTLLQCTAKYPAPLSQMNLKVIPWMRERYGVKVGLSDHSRDPIIAPVAAVALGADIIEKHFTLSNHLPGPDHPFALVPGELKEMVDAIRRAERVGGSGQKFLQPCEEELRSFARRGIQALCDIEEGENFCEGKNIAILRPGNQQRGVEPKYLGAIEGRRAARRIDRGDGIRFGDWSER